MFHSPIAEMGAAEFGSLEIGLPLKYDLDCLEFRSLSEWNLVILIKGIQRTKFRTFEIMLKNETFKVENSMKERFYVFVNHNREKCSQNKT